MKKLILIILAVATMAGTVSAQRVDLFPKKSFYLYSMASFLHTYPDHLTVHKKSGISVILGGGFRLINFHDRYFLNLEIDHTGPGFPEGDRGSNVSITNFKLSVSHTPRWSKNVLLYTGVGVASIHYRNDRFRNQTQTGIVVDGGIKIPVSSSLAFRLEARGYFDSDNSGLYIYTDYDGAVVEHDFFNSLGLSFSAGLEYRF